MKPTQQEIIELAREAGMDVTADESLWWAVHQDELERLVHLALERFSASGGEPARGVVIRDGLPTLLSDRDIKTSDTRLYTHPSPTDLRAEYQRGLEDAAKVADANATDEPYGHAKFRCVNIAEAIRALKGKQ